MQARQERQIGEDAVLVMAEAARRAERDVARAVQEGRLPRALPRVDPPIPESAIALEAAGLLGLVVDVTPILAADWLEHHNRGNRPPTYSQVQKLTRSMAGGWSLTGEAIIFDEDGVLRNGQHRLLACVKSGKSFRTLVVWGVASNAFRHMDRVKTRTLGDVLGIAGVANANTTAAVAGYIWREECGLVPPRRGGTTTPTEDETFDVLQRHPDLVHSLHFQYMMTRVGIYPRSMGVWLHYLFARVDRALADTFFTRLDTGEGLYVGNPILVLRDSLQRYKLSPEHCAAYVIKAWNGWVGGRDIRLLKYGEGEAFPSAQVPTSSRWTAS